MILCNVGDRNFIVNTFSNFIMEKLGLTSSSAIQVVDFINFYVIKGKTNSKTILNLQEVMGDYNEKYQEYLGEFKITSTIDLIEYDVKMDDVKKLTLSLHNTDKCDFHYKQIEYHNQVKKSNDYRFFVREITQNEISYSSEFPNGYSLNQGRTLYYFIKKIFYSIPSSYPITTLTITVNGSQGGDDFLEVFNNHTGDDDEILKSAILDGLSFKKKDIASEIKKVDCNFELLNPLQEHSFLKEGEKFIII